MLDMLLAPDAIDSLEYQRYSAEIAISDYVSGLRTREAQRAFLNALLMPMGWRVSSLPNWRGEGYH